MYFYQILNWTLLKLYQFSDIPDSCGILWKYELCTKNWGKLNLMLAYVDRNRWNFIMIVVMYCIVLLQGTQSISNKTPIFELFLPIHYLHENKTADWPWKFSFLTNYYHFGSYRPCNSPSFSMYLKKSLILPNFLIFPLISYIFMLSSTLATSPLPRFQLLPNFVDFDGRIAYSCIRFTYLKNIIHKESFGFDSGKK